MSENTPYLDEVTQKWKIMVNGKEIRKLYETEAEARTAMEQIDILDSILAIDQVNQELLNE